MTGRKLFENTKKSELLARKSNDAGDDSAPARMTRAQTLLQCGTYQTNLKVKWDGLTDIERKEWDDLAKETNAPPDEDNDEDERICA